MSNVVTNFVTEREIILSYAPRTDVEFKFRCHDDGNGVLMLGIYLMYHFNTVTLAL